jgi:hypothetical protein
MFNSASLIRAVRSMPVSTGECERGIFVAIIMNKLSEKLLISNVSAARYVLQIQRTSLHVQNYAIHGFVVSTLPFVAFVLRTRTGG